MEILVVEDNAVAARLLSSVLAGDGHGCSTARDGAHALEVLDERPEIGLIVTDIVMPRLDGLGFLEALRAKPEWADTPVIVVSATGNAETVRRAAALGVRHFIVSPFRAPHLLECVHDEIKRCVPVLRTRNQVLSQLGISGSTYDDLAEELADQACVTMEALEDALDEDGASGAGGAGSGEGVAGAEDGAGVAGDPGEARGERSEEALRTSLTCVAESAAFLGADRAARALRTVVDDHTTSSDADRRRDGHRIALRELRVLAAALPARATVPNPPPLEGEPADEGDDESQRNLRYITRR